MWDMISLPRLELSVPQQYDNIDNGLRFWARQNAVRGPVGMMTGFASPLCARHPEVAL